jgi:Mrp family chromosome partitioning ATPase
MNDAPRYTSLRDYARVLREQRLLVLAIIVLFTGLPLWASVKQKATYRAEASVAFRDPNLDLNDLGAGVPVTQSDAERAAIAAETVTLPNVEILARRRLPAKAPRGSGGANIDAQVDARTSLVLVRATSHSPTYASVAANAYAAAARDFANHKARNHFASRARALQSLIASLNPRNPSNAATIGQNRFQLQRLRTLAKISQPARIVRPAETEGSKIRPNPVRNTVLGFLAGLTIAIVAAFVRDGLDRRFRSSRDLRNELKLPLIGHIREETLGRSVLSPNGRRALSATELEAFRILRTNVEFLDVDRPPGTIVVTSALPEEGKSTVAAALATAYASAGKRALLVECDLRRPTLAKRMGLKEAPGLSDYLIGHAGPTDIVQSIEVTQAVPDAASGNGDGDAGSGATVTLPLACITAGTRSPQPADLLGSRRFAAFLEQVSEAYDAVILDSSPLLAVVDTLEMVPHVDGVLLCVRASRTTRQDALAAKAALDHFPSRPTGLVVTGLRPSEESEYGYYGYAPA